MTGIHTEPGNDPDRTARISVVVPAHDAQDVLPACLDGLRASESPAHEIVVVDDGSTDRTAEIARLHGARVVATPSKSGPGAARNIGVAQATGDVVLFVDADVVVEPGTLGKVAAHFEAGDVSAVFGSYDDAPARPEFISQYKNLQHHFVHQTGSREASTFWAGCGAIRRAVFLEVGGFDVVRFARPSIEDIELGYRLRDRGHRIVLDAGMTVKHLKRWTFEGLIRTDLFDRALPWSELILERRGATRDLNVGNSERIAAMLVWLSLGFALMTVLDVRAAVPLALSVGLFLVVNRSFYGFLRRRRGAWFTVRAIPVHALYYVYSSAAFLWTWIRRKLR